jgi:hypothetical protein
MDTLTRDGRRAWVCRLVFALALLPSAPVPSLAADPATVATPRFQDGHPDLNGNWVGVTGSVSAVSYPSKPAPQGSIDVGMMSPERAAFALKQMQNTGAGHAAAAFADPTNVPVYKSAALQAKAAALWQDGSNADPVVACAQPGLPRVGAPLKIIQSAKELVFLYADQSGMVWRVIPTDGRGFRDRADPSFYGDAVGHWEGDTLVVDTRNFNDETWFGEYGYFHSDQMRIIERLTRHGRTLTWQATVEDPVVLARPWTHHAVEMTYSDEPLEEPLKCVPTGYVAGHHEQRIP